MKKLSPYNINLPTLTPNKRHSFDFVLDDAFFAAFEQQLILGGNLAAHVDLDRTDRLMTLTFHLTGTVRLTCDRSLEDFDQPIETTESLHVRFGDTTEELADDVLQITSDTQILPLAQHFFDYVATALPMKKLHPRFVEADAAEDAAAGEAAEKADVRLIYTATTDDSAPDDDAADAPADPRWDALRNLN